MPGILYAVPALVSADHAFLVLSGSMVPAFAPGDVIFVEEVPTDSLHVGDVITYQITPGSRTLITHRIIEVLSDGEAVRYRTQGDANEDVDPWVVKQEAIVGVYENKLPYWGLLLKLVRSKIGYLIFILVPAMIVIGKEFTTLYRELDARDRAKRQAASEDAELAALLRRQDPRSTEARP